MERVLFFLLSFTCVPTFPMHVSDEEDWEKIEKTLSNESIDKKNNAAHNDDWEKLSTDLNAELKSASDSPTPSHQQLPEPPTDVPTFSPQLPPAPPAGSPINLQPRTFSPCEIDTDPEKKTTPKKPSRFYIGRYRASGKKITINNPGHFYRDHHPASCTQPLLSDTPHENQDPKDKKRSCCNLLARCFTYCWSDEDE